VKWSGCVGGGLVGVVPLVFSVVAVVGGGILVFRRRGLRWLGLQLTVLGVILLVVNVFFSFGR